MEKRGLSAEVRVAFPCISAKSPCISQNCRERLVRSGLRPPPRTLSNLGISRFAPKGPELAGYAVGAVVSAETNSGVEEISAELSLALKSGCPATETASGRDSVRMSYDYVLKPSIRC